MRKWASAAWASVIFMVPACQPSEVPEDPPGTVVTQIHFEGFGPNAIDFDTGALITSNADLTVDAAGNLIATDEIVSLGRVDGVGDILELPTSGWQPIAGSIGGNGYVLKADTSRVFRFTTTVDGPTLWLRWAPLPAPIIRVELEGLGYGRVQSTPPGIDCTSDPRVGDAPAWKCAEPYRSGTQVTLEATPRSVACTQGGTEGLRSAFSSWTAGACSGTADCSLTTTEADASASALFHRIAVLELGVCTAATGTVSAADGSVTCSTGLCQVEQVQDGRSVLLTATPSASFAFAQWACGGGQPSPTCDAAITGYLQRPCEFSTAATCTLTNPGAFLIHLRARFQ